MTARKATSAAALVPVAELTGHLDATGLALHADASPAPACILVDLDEPVPGPDVARTDAAGVAGMDEAIDRARAYADAGADLIFPEAMAGEADFERFRAAIDVPILANMTEFGKSKLLDAKTLENLGVNVVIYPVTLLRLAMHAAREGLAAIGEHGSQEGLLDRMQHRRDLYDLLDYESYNAFDVGIYNFQL